MLRLLDHVDPSDISKDALMHSIKPLVGLVFVVIEALMHCIGCWSSFVINHSGLVCMLAPVLHTLAISPSQVSWSKFHGIQ